jgi:hypothetical protein
VLVGGDRVDPELLDPRYVCVAVGEDKLCHYIEVDRVVFSVELVPPHEVVALVDEGSGGEAEHERNVLVLVMVDERLSVDSIPPSQEGEHLHHQVPPIKVQSPSA